MNATQTPHKTIPLGQRRNSHRDPPQTIPHPPTNTTKTTLYRHPSDNTQQKTAIQYIHDLHPHKMYNYHNRQFQVVGNYNYSGLTAVPLLRQVQSGNSGGYLVGNGNTGNVYGQGGSGHAYSMSMSHIPTPQKSITHTPATSQPYIPLNPPIQPSTIQASTIQAQPTLQSQYLPTAPPPAPVLQAKTSLPTYTYTYPHDPQYYNKYMVSANGGGGRVVTHAQSMNVGGYSYGGMRRDVGNLSSSMQIQPVSSSISNINSNTHTTTQNLLPQPRPTTSKPPPQQPTTIQTSLQKFSISSKKQPRRHLSQQKQQNFLTGSSILSYLTDKLLASGSVSEDQSPSPRRPPRLSTKNSRIGRQMIKLQSQGQGGEVQGNGWEGYQGRQGMLQVVGNVGEEFENYKNGYSKSFAKYKKGEIMLELDSYEKDQLF